MMNRDELNKKLSRKLRTATLTTLAACSLASSLVMDREANALLQASKFNVEQIEASASYAVPVAYRAAVATFTGQGLPADTCLLLYGLSLLGIAGTAAALYFIETDNSIRTPLAQRAG